MKNEFTIGDSEYLIIKKPEVLLTLTEEEYKLLMECIRIALDEYDGLDEGIEMGKLELEIVSQYNIQKL